MSDRPTVTIAAPAARGAPTWWIILSRELRDLWIGGKALHLILIYSVLLGIYSFLLASNAEVKLLPLKEMILEMVKASIAVCLLMSMMISADSITGERERATLEGLLLTPASRRQIVLGKFIAAVSLCPVALAITVPYLSVLAKGDPVFGPAMLWVVLLGGLLVPALAGIGMLVSLWSTTTKSSMLVTLGIYLLLLLPSELSRPGKVMTSAEMKKAALIQAVNPMDAVSVFLGKTLVGNLPLSELWLLLALPVLFGVVVLVLLFGVASPRLRLEAGTARWFRPYWQRFAGGTR